MAKYGARETRSRSTTTRTAGMGTAGLLLLCVASLPIVALRATPLLGAAAPLRGLLRAAARAASALLLRAAEGKHIV